MQDRWCSDGITISILEVETMGNDIDWQGFCLLTVPDVLGRFEKRRSCGGKLSQPLKP